MFYSLVQRNSEEGVEHKRPVQEIDSLIGGTWVLGLQVYPTDVTERFEILGSFLVGNERHIFLGGSANHVKNDRQLIIGAKGEPVPLLG